MKPKGLSLTEEEREALQKIVKRGSDWRMRERAQTVLYLGEGRKALDIAREQERSLDTVYERRKQWEKSGMASLSDKPRSGAPSKLSAEQKGQVAQWATEQAQTSRELVTRVQEEFQIVLHPNTLAETLKKMKFVWKRTRHSLKKSEMT